MNNVSGCGHVHDEDVTDSPCGAQAGGERGHRPHKLVGVQAALLKQLGLALADHSSFLGSGCLAVGDINKLQLARYRDRARVRWL